MKSVYKTITAIATIMGAFAVSNIAMAWQNEYEAQSGTYDSVDYVQVPTAGYASIVGSLQTDNVDGWQDSASLSINNGPTAYVYGPDFGETSVYGSVGAGYDSVHFHSQIGSSNGSAHFSVEIGW